MCTNLVVHEKKKGYVPMLLDLPFGICVEYFSRKLNGEHVILFLESSSPILTSYQLYFSCLNTNRVIGGSLTRSVRRLFW